MSGEYTAVEDNKLNRVLLELQYLRQSVNSIQADTTVVKAKVERLEPKVEHWMRRCPAWSISSGL